MQKISACLLSVLYIAIIMIAAYFCLTTIKYPKKYSVQIQNACTEFEIPQSTFYALINTESGFNPNAKSSAGAIGLTQVLPSTAEYICVKNNIDYSSFDLYNPNDNIYIGAMYLRYLFDKFNNRYTALAAYNAGETVVRNWLKDARYSYDHISLYNIPYKETNNYINKIKNNEKIYINFYKMQY